MAEYATTALARGMQFLAESQAAIAHNLANVETAGFKRRLAQAVPASASFASMLAQPLPSVQFASRTDWTPGSLMATGAKLHVAIEGEGFFQVEGRDGSRYLTRNGTMLLDPHGQLITPSGHWYLDANGQRIGLGSREAIDQTRIAISPAGTISASGATVGQLAVLLPEDPARLEPAGDSLWRDQSHKPAQPIGRASIRQGYVERSNVDSLSEMVQMIAIERSFAASSKVLATLGRLETGYIQSLNR